MQQFLVIIRKVRLLYFFFFFNTSSFLIWMFSFSFSCLITLARILKRSDESEHLCLVFDLRGKAFNFLPLNTMLTVGLLVCGLYCVETCSFHTQYWVPLSWKNVLFCQFFFLDLLRWSYYFLYHSINVIYNIYWFV